MVRYHRSNPDSDRDSIVLTAPEVKAALEEFVGVVAELAAVPDADKMTLGRPTRV